jgi:hypothetical protein
MSAGLLFSQMEPPPGWEDDFHDWYEHEHIPARMAIPGFAEAIRYEHDGDGTEAARYLACYFLDDVAALETDAYRRLKADPGERTARMLANVAGFTRYIADERSDTGTVDERPRLLFAVAFAVPEDDRPDFDGWYEDEHVPLLMRVPGWLRVRRYLVRPGSAGPPWTHIALHELRGPEALAAPEREAARATPRRAELATRPWFRSGRWTYRPIHRATATTRKD